MTYKRLFNSEVILRLVDGASIPPDPANVDYQQYLAWVEAGNEPQVAEQPTQEQLDREEEMRQARPTARQWFASHQVAVNFVRLTPAQQESQIDGMTTAQLKEVVKFLAVAVAMLVKRELL